MNEIAKLFSEAGNILIDTTTAIPKKVAGRRARVLRQAAGTLRIIHSVLKSADRGNSALGNEWLRRLAKTHDTMLDVVRCGNKGTHPVQDITKAVEFCTDMADRAIHG